MLETICANCQFGEHDRCQGGQAPPEGMMGGWHCRCKGECADGRYVPQQFKNTEAAIKKAFAEQKQSEDLVADLGEKLDG